MTLDPKDPVVNRTIIRNSLLLSAALVFFGAMLFRVRLSGAFEPDETTGQIHHLLHQYVTGSQIAGFWLSVGLVVIAIINNLAYIFRMRRRQNS
jgi:hypothetical protein